MKGMADIAVIKVAPGYMHGAVLAGGRRAGLYTWQLSPEGDILRPKLETEHFQDVAIRDVECGGDFTVVVTEGGEALVWQLPPRSDRAVQNFPLTPTRVPLREPISRVACGVLAQPWPCRPCCARERGRRIWVTSSAPELTATLVARGARAGCPRAAPLGGRSSRRWGPATAGAGVQQVWTARDRGGAGWRARRRLAARSGGPGRTFRGQLFGRCAALGRGHSQWRSLDVGRQPERPVRHQRRHWRHPRGLLHACASSDGRAWLCASATGLSGGRAQVPRQVAGGDWDLSGEGELIACGHSHTLWTGRREGLFACGRNAYGQLGIGSTADTAAPTRVRGGAAFDRFMCVAAGECHSLAVTVHSTVFVWGSGARGQLGAASAWQAVCHTPRALMEVRRGMRLNEARCGPFSSFLHSVDERLTAEHLLAAAPLPPPSDGAQPPLVVVAASWNVNSGQPGARSLEWLRPAAQQADIVAVALQEVDLRSGALLLDSAAQVPPPRRALLAYLLQGPGGVEGLPPPAPSPASSASPAPRRTEGW
jgi:hypothetical protein